MRLTRLVLPTAVAVVAASAVAYAAASSGDTVNGCVTSSGKNKGELRVLTGAGKCSKSETAISWSKTGPQGAPGAKGDAGPRGDTGPAGPQGPAAPSSAAEALILGGKALADASVDAYIKWDGIEGEATTAGYEGQSALKSFGMSIDQTVSPTGVASKTTVGTFKLTKLVDKSSPVLAKKTAQGVHHTNVQISFVRQTSFGPKQYMTIKMASVVLSHWELGGEKEPATLERLELVPQQYTIAYKPMDAQGGLGGEVKFSHNVVTTEIS